MKTQELKQELKYVTRRRAAVLLGLSEMELSRISSESGFGHKEVAGEEDAPPSDPGFFSAEDTK